MDCTRCGPELSIKRNAMFNLFPIGARRLMNANDNLRLRNASVKLMRKCRGQEGIQLISA